MEQRSLFSPVLPGFSGAQNTGFHFSLRKIVVFLFLFVMLVSTLIGRFVVSPSLAAHADTNALPKCNQHVISVKLSPLGLVTYHVVGWLCYRGPLSQYRLVQLLVPGATYNHSYWDFSYQPGTYSYVEAMENAGYAVFNYDRLGEGLSDHPLPELLTIEADAYILHQIVRDLHAGTVEGYAFSKVLLVGHSLGSAISLDEAETYADVNGVLLTGFLHFVDPAALPEITAHLSPADLDPHFQGQGLLPGYLTTVPNSRSLLFDYVPNTDPQVIATDEATKDTMTDSELASFFTVSNSPLSLFLRVPVLEVVGQYDNIFCLGTLSCTNSTRVWNYESLYFSPQAHLQVIVVPKAGHDLNLQLNAPTVWYPQAIHWIQSTF
jgi:pimeloyl-ACP methyl ester carboxylesterase